MPSILEPLRQPAFRRIWLASLLSNFGLLIQGVGAAWTMTQLSSSPQLVALVQSAVMLPTMLFSVVAGALADMYDRRKVALGALALSLTGVTALLLTTHFNLLTPTLLLCLCFVVGSGQALFSPSWQASVREQVPPDALRHAVGLNSISYNLARSFGPALGGMIVAIGGSIAAFAMNALLYLPLMLVLFLWRRVREVPRLPPERLLEAVSSGVRYIIYSPPVRSVLVRTLTVSTGGGVIHAMLPLVARAKLHGDVRIYGLLLGLFGIGAVIGALGISPGCRCNDRERSVVADTLVLAVAVMVIGASPHVWLTGIALIVAGSSWLALANIFNISVQMAAARWVSGRALAGYQAAISGGVAIGSWIWGMIAGVAGVSAALFAAALLLALLPLLARWFPMPALAAESREEVAALAEASTALALTPRSGPIVLTIEYRVDPTDARAFYGALQALQLVRQRNGARDWSVSRDIDDPALWTERFQFSTWLEYRRHRDRATSAERELRDVVVAFHHGSGPLLVRRMLGRPLGSVRWKEEAPDIAMPTVQPLTGPT